MQGIVLKLQSNIGARDRAKIAKSMHFRQTLMQEIVIKLDTQTHSPIYSITACCLTKVLPVITKLLKHF